MKRSTFFTITALIACMFGIGMIVMPVMIAETFGLTSLSTVTDFLLRCMGSMLFSIGVANFLVRKQEDSIALKAVLIMNIVYHLLSAGVDFSANIMAVLPTVKSLPAYAVHLFVGVGSYIYLRTIKTG